MRKIMKWKKLLPSQTKGSTFYFGTAQIKSRNLNIAEQDPVLGIDCIMKRKLCADFGVNESSKRSRMAILESYYVWY